MSDQDRISLSISMPYHVDKWWELRKISIMGLLILITKRIPNYPNQYNENHLADKKENC